MFSTLFTFIGFQEVTVILLISVLVFGPKKIPEIARGLGEGLRAMREATDEIKREVMNGVDNAQTTGELKKTQAEIENEIAQAKEKIESAIGPVKRDKI